VGPIRQIIGLVFLGTLLWGLPAASQQSAEQLLRQARSEFNQRKFSEAIELCQQQKRIQPITFLYASQLLIKLSQYDEAAKALSELIAVFDFQDN